MGAPGCAARPQVPRQGSARGEGTGQEALSPPVPSCPVPPGPVPSHPSGALFWSCPCTCPILGPSPVAGLAGELEPLCLDAGLSLWLSGMKLKKQVTVCGAAIFCVAVFSLYLMLDRVQHDPTRHQSGGNFPRVSGRAVGMAERAKGARARPARGQPAQLEAFRLPGPGLVPCWCQCTWAPGPTWQRALEALTVVSVSPESDLGAAEPH